MTAKNYPPFTQQDVILQVVPELDSGGAEQSSIDIANALLDAGAKPFIWALGGRLLDKLKNKNEVHIDHNMKSKNPLIILKNAFALVSFIRKNKVTLIHARSRAPAWSAWIAAKITGIPYITTFHATYNYSNALKKFYNTVMVRSKTIIANSDFIKNHIVQHYHIPAEQVTVIHRGVHESYFDDQDKKADRVQHLHDKWNLRAQEKVILVPARLTRWKGQESVVRALAGLKTENYKCIFLGGHQGREDYYHHLQNLAREHDVADHVFFENHCNDMPAAYELADVVISSSIEDEAFGRVIIEAQACGRPVIVTKMGAYRETSLENETGFWIEPNDPVQMAAKIDEILLMNEDQKEKLAVKAIAFVKEHYMTSHMCEKTLALYKDALQRSKFTSP